jgi:hypothetical protein
MKNKRVSSETGFILSVLSFLAFGCLIYFNMDQRLLGEGAKELISIINKDGFFYLHAERVFMFISEVLVVVGLKFNASLPTLKVLYNFNILVVSLLVYVYFIVKKDSIVGLYIVSSVLVGVGTNFFTHPFLEHLYSIIFCFLLIHILKSEKNSFTPFIVFPFIFLIASFYPSNVLYLITIFFLSKIDLKEKFVYSISSFIIALILIFVTEIPVENRLNSVLAIQLSPQLWLYSLLFNLDVSILILITCSIILKHYNKLILAIYLAISALPFIFTSYLPSYYFMLPVGISFIIMLNTTVYRKTTNVVLVMFVLALSIFKISYLGSQYSHIVNDLNSMIKVAKKCESNKFVIKNNPETEKYFHHTRELNLDENIRHSILLLSANTPSETVWIESYEFNNSLFGDLYFSEHSNGSEEGLINYLYDKRNIYTDKYRALYEYNAFYFGVSDLNNDYFQVSTDDGFKNIDYCLSSSPE